ncbi:hypothetical protein M5X06_03905 [Paenibacillus alvei]|uniref:Uncharacterized protein n=1 Tax=Paenibacillus alvei TaxID=44250 RepID=A0ABT4H777_PAEAL|nr:hypothetical protein [Paenibacillus alvei]MCY9764835.1 hypothetical protein [Paenibacillus alvei]MCY9765983.1 hypothetical protein [Paenibacillus alvei]
MTSEELKEVMTHGVPVEHRGTIYNYVSAIIYRKSESGMFMQVELFDKTGNSVVIARPNEIKRVKEK